MKTIDYKRLQKIMKEVEICAQKAQEECKKANPSIVVLCDNCIEDIGNLIDRAERTMTGLD